MSVSELDLQFAAVTWMVNQNIDSLNEEEKSFITSLFTYYCDYARGSKTAEEKVRYLLDVLVGKAVLDSVEQSKNLFQRTLREQAVFGMFAEDNDEDVEEIKSQPVVLYGKNIDSSTPQQIKRERQKIQKTKLMGEKVKSLSAQGTSNEEIMAMLRLVAQQNIELRKQLSVHGEALETFSESTESNRAAMEVQFHDLGKGMTQMDLKIKELYDMQLTKTSLTDLKWQQIPDWFRQIYVGGIKRAAVGLVKLPFKIASIAVDRIIYRPMVRAYDFWGGKVELVVGTIYWIIVIAGVIHIYQQTDWETVNITYKKYGGEYFDKYLFSGIDLLKTSLGYFPEAQQVANSVKIFFFQKMITPILEIVYSFWQALLALLTVTANAAISKLPYADWWFVPRTAIWPNTPLFKAAQSYFGV